MKLEIASPVREALAAGRPVVALETTLITHGMDYPDNLEIARAMEAAIAAEGACAATLGIVAGDITVGLSPGSDRALRDRDTGQHRQMQPA